MTEFCGDGVTNNGVEQCDTGAANSNTGAVGSFTAACSLQRCGDGFLASNEQCDDGNVFRHDGCSRPQNGAAIHWH